MPNWTAAVAVSPPPMMLTAPLAVAAATASASARVPAAKAGISKTPAGPFQTMVFARPTAAAKAAALLGPTSRPSQPAGTPAASSTTLVAASAANLSAAT